MAERTLSVSLAAPGDLFEAAVRNGGGTVVPLGPETRMLLWNRGHDAKGLAAMLPTLPQLEWVQLPSAGIDDFAAAGVIDPAYIWTSAKGSYSQPVAEHALALTLALLRQLHLRARATAWGKQVGKMLYGAHVVILGGGGIAQEYMRLCRPFDVRTTVLRRSGDAVEGADRTLTTDRLDEVLPDADVFLIAAPLTDETRGLVGAKQFALMRQDAVLVNVARGPIVRTNDLVAALSSGRIAGAALDVTDPEPLPDGHPLWSEPRALITPHSADTAEMIMPLLARRVTENVRCFMAGQPLVGVVDSAAGY
ncbi:D-isomer specific 2-hydroxyacid dehydrogenase family protein [soil metagenome]